MFKLRRHKPRNHPFHRIRVRGDVRGVPTAECVCGSQAFYTVMWVDPNDYTVGGYETTGLCAVCGCLVTVATEIDHYEYEEGWL